MGDKAPIIIKRKKIIAGGGHHGGAWKVAYADFVTAMMAFFMLMWLLNATTETQRKGLADYFSPTISVARISGGGDGALSGDSLMSQKTLSQNGRGGYLNLPPSNFEENAASGVENQNNAVSDEDLAEVQRGLMGRGGESLIAEMALQHIITRVTDEGLVIELFDLPGEPLFDPATSEPSDIMVAIGDIVIDVFSVVQNKVAIAAHTKTYTLVRLENPAWNISTARAHAVRKLLETRGFDEKRLHRVTGYGQKKPLLSDPMAERNNRLELTLLRRP